MFWDLNGATEIPRSERSRQTAATTVLLPTCEAVPRIISDTRESPEDGATGGSGELLRRYANKYISRTGI
jgi:hypothetical protein